MRSCRSTILRGIQVISMFALSAKSSANPRQLTPTQTVQELLHHAAQQTWHRELQSASKIVSQRYERRNKARKLQYNNNDGYQAQDASSSSCLSPLQKWFVSLIESIGMKTWDEINAYNITSLAYLYKHHVSSADGTDEFFGVYGDRTDEMKDNHNSLINFWDTGGEKKSSDVLLLGMHGTDLSDTAKLVPTLQQMYNLDGKDAFALSGRIQAIIETLPGAFNNPVLTANAIAIQSSNPDGSKREKDSIIIGDGVFDFLEWLDLDRDGPDYIHSHEFGHHLMYDLGVSKMGWSMSEETRRFELMADVFGSYYNAHANGGRMDSNRLLEVHRAAYSLGDCENSISSHHGTPRQRECSSNFGSNLALSSYIDGGYTIPPSELRRMFDKRYQSILALDEDQCEGVLDASLLDRAIYGDDNSGVSGSFVNTPPDFELPSWNAPPDTIEYEPWVGSYFGDSSAQDDDWAYGTFEAYNPEEDVSHENEFDEPPPLVNNGDFARDEGWFGSTQSQIWTRSSAGNCVDIGWRNIFFAVVTVNWLFNLE